MTEKKYPSVMKLWQNAPISVSSEEWVSQSKAAEVLGISGLRIGYLVSCGHLQPAENERGSAGVTLSSLNAEKEWRVTASKRAKAARLVKDVLRSL
ncbi:DNA-binding protein [Streptomyces hundungensis]|uniref:DNA-binding protein n=1 Tax=Streptomyces hundungensis TaxID=1077946 RepID=UPI0033D8E73E